MTNLYQCILTRSIAGISRKGFDFQTNSMSTENRPYLGWCWGTTQHTGPVKRESERKPHGERLAAWSPHAHGTSQHSCSSQRYFQKRRAGICKHAAWVERCPCTKQAVKLRAAHFARPQQTKPGPQRKPSCTPLHCERSEAIRWKTQLPAAGVVGTTPLMPGKAGLTPCCHPPPFLLMTQLPDCFSPPSHSLAFKWIHLLGPRPPESLPCISRLTHARAVIPCLGLTHVLGLVNNPN